jgi:gluconokinase
MAGEIVLTLDVGTSSSRAMLFDGDGRAVPGAETQITHQARVTPDGGVELDPEMLFTHTTQAIDGTLPHLPSGSRIAAVAISTIWHSVMGLDDEMHPLTSLLTWADTRAAAAAAELRQRLDEAAVHARTGCLLHPSYLPARLAWLSASRPDVWRSVRRWASFGEYLHLRLFGRCVCSVSMASGTGLLDVHRCAWDDEVMEAIGLAPDLLSPLGDTGDVLQGLRPEWAERWPALKDVPWLPAIGDGACSNVGSGCVDPSQIALMVGTSGATRVVLSTPDAGVLPGLFLYRVDRRRPIIGGATSEGGNLFAWMRSALRLDELSQLEAEIATMAPDAHGLTVLPFWAGERAPGWAAEARGALVGLTLATRPIDILRAGLEAIAYRFALIHELLRAVASPDAVVVASGGALLGSPAWLTIMSDVLGRTVVASQVSEASSRGAALLALEALGLIPDLKALPAAAGRSYQADAARHAAYQSGLARQKHLYDLLVRQESKG